MSDFYIYAPIEEEIPDAVVSICWSGGFYFQHSDEQVIVKQVNSDKVIRAQYDDVLDIRVRDGRAIEIVNLDNKEALCAFTTKTSGEVPDDATSS